MNKTAIKNFAVWARNKLIKEITYKAGLLGITDKAIAEELEGSTNSLKLYDIGTKEPVKVQGNEISQRNALADKIKTKANEISYKDAFEFVIEEVAYTWFNRLIAIRFMEVNDYLPSGVRVLSSESKGKKEPDMVTTPFETDIDFTSADKAEMQNLKDDELFRFLFIKQCNKLHDYLPELFEEINNYTEILLNISFTDEDGIVYHLVNDISEEDFGEQVQIIGWLYQYYNSEPKDKVFANLKKNVKISKENIPAATQLFTPDWIVRYMVENSLGRLWVDGHADYDKSEWKYYLDEAEQEESVKVQLESIKAEYKNISPEDIKFIDPCMGSGHILVYAFDVLMQIYLSQGYIERDAAQLIIEKNLYGMDIDKRAYQLSYFALMMKGRASDRRFLTRDIKPNLVGFSAIAEEPIAVSFLDDKLIKFTEQFKNVDTYGSLLEVSGFDTDEIENLINSIEDGSMAIECKPALEKMLFAYRLMSQKYDVVVTNPPYMGGSGMDAKLSDFVKKNYPDSKSDMFAIFIEKCGQFSKQYYAMITQHAFMFLSSYEKLRTKLLNHTTINMAHLGTRAFDEIGGEVVQTTAFINTVKRIKGYAGLYARLVDINGENEKAEMFLSGENRYTANQSNFSKIPGSPVAYWVSENFIRAFENKTIADYGFAGIGMRTGDNNRFLRLWYEINRKNLLIGCDSSETQVLSQTRWIPYNKGGEFRRWYGNNDYVVDWYNNGYEIKENTIKVYPQLGDDLGWKISNEQYYYRKGITWSGITSSKCSYRVYDEGFIFDSGANGLFAYNEDDRLYLSACLNSNIILYTMSVINPTINNGAGTIRKLPVIMDLNKKPTIDTLVQENIALSKNDWDSFETSWDFEKHPFINGEKTIKSAFEKWSDECEQRFSKLKSNEEELNRIFIDIYGLQDELTPEVEEKDVTVRRSDLTRDVKSFISYAVGCMFGRYSLDVDGLAYAGGEWDSSKYATFIPDTDNCIPVTDTDYFSDDIVNRFVEFVKVVYGADTLEENLKFIADALGNKGLTSRDVIREYFLKDFMKDHVKTYQKRPVYWLFDSGKQNGFKALVYMHRWNQDTIGNVRVEYLHKLQRIYERTLEDLQDTIDNSDNSKDIAKAEKQKDKITKQLKETRDYDERIAHLALMRIDIDLDDGVKVNYEKVQTADGKNLEILTKI